MNSTGNKNSKLKLFRIAYLLIACLATMLLTYSTFATLPRHVSRFDTNWKAGDNEPRDHLLAGEVLDAAADAHVVVQYLRQHVIQPPSTLPYNLKYGPQHDPSDGQAAIIDGLLDHMRGGFYVESGGYTGEGLSNSLLFETQRDWQGILIEPDSKNFAKLVTRNRKTHTAHACLADSHTTKNALFQMDKYAGGVVTYDNFWNTMVRYKSQFTVVPCFPLRSFMLALNRTTIDYFSLDIEGTEYKVLELLPWHHINIKTLSVEWNKIPEGKEALIKLMTSKGYLYYMLFNRNLTHDLIFVKKGLLTDKQLANITLPIINDVFYQKIYEM